CEATLRTTPRHIRTITGGHPEEWSLYHRSTRLRNPHSPRIPHPSGPHPTSRPLRGPPPLTRHPQTHTTTHTAAAPSHHHMHHTRHTSHTGGTTALRATPQPHTSQATAAATCAGSAR